MCKGAAGNVCNVLNSRLYSRFCLVRIQVEFYFCIASERDGSHSDVTDVYRRELVNELIDEAEKFGPIKVFIDAVRGIQNEYNVQL
ncbi:hypothetical protein DPMN_160145 [Dreissena polymorpha]|uniref:Uncharacterized protein n=1 Tax=Dreissena polymorpha TaxID=45954 RepID=A0A9D4EMY0_DREPO|nr:hypothetical protein DPMN_160145 [Dreissena polymorpha]